MTHSQHDLECLQAQNPGTPHVSPVKQTGTLVLSPRSRRNDQSAERAERALRARHSLSLVRSVPGHVQVWWCQTANSQKPSRYWFRFLHLTRRLSCTTHSRQTSHLGSALSAFPCSMATPARVFSGRSHAQPHCQRLITRPKTADSAWQQQAVNPKKPRTSRRSTTPVWRASTLLRTGCPAPTALRTPDGITRIQKPRGRSASRFLDLLAVSNGMLAPNVRCDGRGSTVNSCVNDTPSRVHSGA